ncbi:MAG: hypothetical protein LQ342_008313 [Letrouitia transgressa]|nr:MAG: hypothetical protein LQ342_008313 [Letrouitia transgressa]
MAAPPEIALTDLNGYWVMSKSLSDPLDPVLTLQGINWLIRKIVSMATVTMHVIEFADENGTTNITIEQTATGGIKGETEVRKLDWSEVPHSSGVFGEMNNRSRWTGIGSSAESGGGGPLHPWLTEGWLEEKTAEDGKEHIQNWVVNERSGWTAEQVWGFAEVNGERHHVRKFMVKKDEEEAKARMVYVWKGRNKT